MEETGKQKEQPARSVHKTKLSGGRNETSAIESSKRSTRYRTGEGEKAELKVRWRGRGGGPYLIPTHNEDLSSAEKRKTKSTTDHRLRPIIDPLWQKR